MDGSLFCFTWRFYHDNKLNDERSPSFPKLYVVIQLNFKTIDKVFWRQSPVINDPYV